jgi:hypothetical protein
MGMTTRIHEPAGRLSHQEEKSCLVVYVVHIFHENQGRFAVSSPSTEYNQKTIVSVELISFGQPVPAARTNHLKPRSLDQAFIPAGGWIVSTEFSQVSALPFRLLGEVSSIQL